MFTHFSKIYLILRANVAQLVGGVMNLLSLITLSAFGFHALRRTIYFRNNFESAVGPRHDSWMFDSVHDSPTSDSVITLS
jgi:hypothetical protein